MNDSPSDIVRQLLLTLGLGAIAAYANGAYTGQPWPIFAANEPASPDNVITVYDTTGQSDGRTMPDGEECTHYGIQLRVRAVDEPTGWPVANNLRNALARLVPSPPTGTNYVTLGPNNYTVWAFAGIGNVIPLGKETPSSARFLFTVNALVAIRPWQNP